jgi:hypothetical protein
MTDSLLPSPGLSLVSGKFVVAKFDGGLLFPKNRKPIKVGVSEKGNVEHLLLPATCWVPHQIHMAFGFPQPIDSVPRSALASHIHFAKPARPFSESALGIDEIDTTIF